LAGGVELADLSGLSGVAGAAEATAEPSAGDGVPGVGVADEPELSLGLVAAFPVMPALVVVD